MADSEFNLRKFLLGKISRKIFFGFLIIALFLGIIAVIGSLYMNKISVAETPGEMYQLTNNIQTIIVVLISITFMIIMIIGGFVSSSISRPIQQLRDATGEIEKKNFKVRVNIKTGDELEKLGESFNKTAEALEKMDQEYKKLDSAKTEFLSITSHELRSPMTPMKAQLQMILGDYFGKLTKEQRESLQIVLNNTERLDKIIVDFLEISRIEAARLKFAFIRTDLTEHINRVVEEMKSFLPEKNLEIETKIEKLPVIEVEFIEEAAIPPGANKDNKFPLFEYEAILSDLSVAPTGIAPEAHAG